MKCQWDQEWHEYILNVCWFSSTVLGLMKVCHSAVDPSSINPIYTIGIPSSPFVVWPEELKSLVKRLFKLLRLTKLLMREGKVMWRQRR